MDTIRFVAMPTDVVEALQSGQPDANGQTPERHISEGDGVPCRHCLTDVAKGEPYLILHHRPFPAPQPYAESGPIFLHADGCPRYAETAATPPIFLCREDVLLRGYNSEHRIVYGTGQVTRTADIANAAQQIFERPDVAYIHARSTTNNCYQCRIERGN